MLYSEIITVCSQIHTKHINTLCGQNVELLHVKLAVHIMTIGLYVTIDKGLEFETKYSVALHCCTSSLLHQPHEFQLFVIKVCLMIHTASILRHKLADKGPNKLSVNITTAQLAVCNSL